MASATKTLVLNHIWNTPGAHRKQIAACYSLHPNLVSDAVRELLDEKWVVEGGAKTSASGRAPIALHVDTQSRAALVASYSNSSMTCGLVNAAGEVLKSISVRHDLRRPVEIVNLAARLTSRLQHEYKGIIIGLGVADPGMIDHNKGEVVRSSSFAGWHHVELAKMFEAKTSLKTVVTDVTHAHALVQRRLLPESSRTEGTMLYVDYDAGILGFVLLTPSGIWRGGGFAGEVGHVMVDPAGEICRCGGRGCLENKTNSVALEKHAALLMKKGVNSVLRKQSPPCARDIFSAAKRGDRFARTVVHDVLGELGLYVAVITAMHHPRLLVVGAETEDAVSVLADELKQAVATRLPAEIASTVSVIGGRPIAPLGLAGAGLMMFEKVIRSMERPNCHKEAQKTQ